MKVVHAPVDHTNSILETYLPYDLILPKASVFVNNGGYNGVRRALSYGVPIVSAGNPVIVLIPLPDGGYHFVVIVGKEGRDYLIRDPAASPLRRAYHLRDLMDQIAGLCFFRTI